MEHLVPYLWYLWENIKKKKKRFEITEQIYSPDFHISKTKVCIQMLRYSMYFASQHVSE